MSIELDGSKFGTNNGTTDLIEMSRNLYHNEITSSIRSRILVSKRGREMFESMPRATRSTPTPPGDAAPTETGVARGLAKAHILIGLRRALWTQIPICLELISWCRGYDLSIYIVLAGPNIPSV